MIVYRGFKIYYLGLMRYKIMRGESGFTGTYPGGISEILRDIDDVLQFLF